MRNRALIKMLGMLTLLGAIIITAGVGAGAAALQVDHKKSETAIAQAKESTKENTKENVKEDTAEVKNESEAELISKFETVNKEDIERDKNLKIACAKLNGHEIKPQEVFSFIETAGPFTEEEGYVNGPVILDSTQMGEGIAGGVCQVSTTLYNAALTSNMEIVERKRHSFPMNYVSVGQDAAISAPDLDLKLKNNADTSMYIFATAEKGTVMIQIFGKPLEKEADIRIQSIVKQEFQPEGAEVRFSDTLQPGEKQVIQEERTGYEVIVYREYYKSNEMIDKQVISEDTYPAVQGIVLEGNSNTNK